MPLAFFEPLLMRTTTCTERFCRLQHYSQVVEAYITLKTICSLTVSITGLPRAHSDGVVYQEVNEPRYIIAKNAMSIFMMNAVNYITLCRAICKVYLRKLHTKKWFYIFVSHFIHISTKRTQNFKASNNNISFRNNRKVKY